MRELKSPDLYRSLVCRDQKYKGNLMEVNRRLEIDKWAYGIQLPVAIWAPQFATSTEALIRILTFSKNKEPIPKIKFPQVVTWLRLYRNHRSIQRVLTSAFKNFGGFNEIGANLMESIFDSKKNVKKHLSEGEKQKVLDHFYQISLAKIESDIDDQIDENSLPLFLNLFQIPEYVFLIKVLVPCWMFYGTHPAKLLYKARNGNFSALEKLLRLDVAVLFDPRISKQFMEFSHQKGKRKFNKLLEALGDGPNKKVSMKKVKYFLSGLISIWSEMLDCRLTAVEIRKLFNAVAIDFAKGKNSDPDLPLSEETFSTAIKRERRFWLPLLKPDNKI